MDVAEDIIKNSPYKLWKNEEYVGAWSKISGVHSNEMLFEIAITGSTDWTDREGIAYLYNEDGYADIIATKNFSIYLMKIRMTYVWVCFSSNH